MYRINTVERLILEIQEMRINDPESAANCSLYEIIDTAMAEGEVNPELSFILKHLDVLMDDPNGGEDNS